MMYHDRSKLRRVALIVGCLALPLAAQAQTFPTCKLTTGTYNGNLGGMAGADTKCAAEFPGYRFARNPKVVYLTYDAASGLTNTWGWVGGSSASCAPGGTLWAYNSSSGFYGLAIMNPGYSGITADQNNSSSANYDNPGRGLMGQTIDCTSSLKLWCCNF